jgi:nucleoside-diphosphate-sugar epimerase
MENSMTTVLILGANGRLGHVATAAFLSAGWQVRAFVRPGRSHRVAAGATIIEGDAHSATDLNAAAENAQVIFNGLNPPYTQWRKEALHLANTVIEACRSSGATQLFPANIYNFGARMPDVLNPTTLHAAETVKGRIRVQMESRFRSAAEHGQRTIALRAGDFFGGTGRGSWFDLAITKSVANDRVTYPGPLNVSHAWAYLPDLARAFVGLAERRAELPPYCDLTFAGHTATGGDMVTAIEAALGRPMKVANLPWALIRLAAPFVRSWAEIVEISYLWTTPHRLDGAQVTRILGPLAATPFDIAIADALADLGHRVAQAPRLARVA